MIASWTTVSLAGTNSRCQSASLTEPPSHRVELSAPRMGTTFTVILYGPQPDDARRAAQEALDHVETLNAILSDYDPESELMAFRGRAGDGAWVELSQPLFECLSRSRELAERTGGAFDPTAAPVIRLWRRARRTGERPREDLLRDARERVDWRALELDPGRRAGRLTRERVGVDLGGIAKGYAADAAHRLLVERGYPCCLVAASGDLRLGDPPPGQNGWIVALETLEPMTTPSAIVADSAPPPPTLSLSRCGISTSGDAEQFVVIDGVRYSHIIDPRTGEPLTTRMSVTVIAPDATTSDSWATALAVLGPEKGLALLRPEDRLDVRFAILDDQNRLRITTTPGFGDR